MAPSNSTVYLLVFCRIACLESNRRELWDFIIELGIFHYVFLAYLQKMTRPHTSLSSEHTACVYCDVLPKDSDIQEENEESILQICS